MCLGGQIVVGRLGGRQEGVRDGRLAGCLAGMCTAASHSS